MESPVGKNAIIYDMDRKTILSAVIRVTVMFKKRRENVSNIEEKKNACRQSFLHLCTVYNK